MWVIGIDQPGGTMRTFVLFTHIVGAMLLFASFGTEWIGLRGLRRSEAGEAASPWLALFSSALRLYLVALAALLLSGAYLATNVGVWQFGWVRVSMATLVITTVVGVVMGLRERRSYRRASNVASPSGRLDRRFGGTWLPVSLAIRGVAALAIVYVMVAKSDLVLSLTVIAAAAGLAGLIVTFRSARETQPIAQRQSHTESVGAQAAALKPGGHTGGCV
jgi:hypothetical protein